MKDKQLLLAELSEALRNGTVTSSDVLPLITHSEKSVEEKSNDLSAVDVMFYIGGIVLFAAICAVLSQAWNDSNSFARIFLSAGIGIILWAIALLLIRRRTISDIRKGLINALLLTGSLSVILGGFVTDNQIVNGNTNFGVEYLLVGATLLIVSALFILYDRFVRRDLILLLGILIGVSALPTFLSQPLHDTNAPLFLWCLIVAAAAVVLVYTIRTVARILPTRNYLRHTFDAFATFLVLASLYIASTGDDLAVLWLVILIAAILGMFYLSIVRRNKYFLGNASLFLVITIVTIAFRYFSGYGIATSLLIAAFGLLGSATAASIINKKYIRE